VSLQITRQLAKLLGREEQIDYYEGIVMCHAEDLKMSKEHSLIAGTL
jgi:hypothetical protein